MDGENSEEGEGHWHWIPWFYCFPSLFKIHSWIPGIDAVQGGETATVGREKKDIFTIHEKFLQIACQVRISYPISSRGSVVSVWLCEMYHLHKLRCKMGTLYILQILMHCTFSILVGGSTKNVWGFEHFFLNSVQEEVYHFTWSWCSW